MFPLLLILLFSGTTTALPTVAHDTVQGEMYVSSTANWPSTYSTNNFYIPNGTVVFARYYVGIWAGQSTHDTIATTFNGYALPTHPSYYSTEMGATWIPYDITDYVLPGKTNTAIINSSSWGDGRQYGSTLVVVLENESKPQIEYWVAEGCDWMHYDGYLGYDVPNSLTYFNGTVYLADVQNASLYSTHLTGFNYEDLNGNSLPGASASVSGEYFNYIQWDNLQESLVPENQTVLVSRGSDTYCSVVFNGLEMEYKVPDLVLVNLTPSVVTANTTNTMTATIENRGSKDSQPFNVSLMADGTVVDSQAVDGLTTGSSTTVDLYWTPDGSKDAYSLNVVADPDNLIVESNETNNVLTVLVGTTSATSPVAEFIVDKTSGDAPLMVNFTDRSTNSPTSWAWDFENNGVVDSIEQNPTHIYSTPGTYNVNLTVTNAGGTSSTMKTGYITAFAVTPVADFTAIPTSGAPPLTVTFTDQSTNLPTSWAWDFENDGTVDSTEQNPVHTYSIAGNYAVNLTVTNAAGSDSEVKAGYVAAVTKPVANFTATPTSGDAPLTVTFTDLSANSPTTWLWDFGDGTGATSQNPLHTYSKPGTYTVNLTATNAGGTNSTVKTDYIEVLLAIGPVWEANSSWDIYVGSYVVPCFTDLDGDGDYDLLIGEKSGISYAYENTGTKNSPVWEARSEWNTPDVITGSNNYAAPCSADLDGDGDFDLLIGDNKGNTSAYENTGTKNSPVWTAKTEWNVPDVGYYAAPYLADLDGDGDYDLLIGEYYGTLYSYENTGTKNSPVWTAKTEWNVPYTGSSGRPTTRPAIADFDDDGDYDLLIGEYEGFTSGYENTGTKNNPVWTGKLAWYAPDIGLNAKPDIADLDGDGDYDLLIGSQSGNSYAYENIAAQESKPDLTPTAVILPSSIIANTSCTISATINNTGTFDVGAFTASLSVNGTVVDTQAVSGIAVGNSTSVSFSWTPEAAGNYNLTVTADPENGIAESDETNNTLTITATATVASPALVADFTVNMTSGDVPLTVQFTDTSIGSPTSWLWDFGDGSNATSQNPVHTYSTEGTYTVNLKVTNAAGSNASEKVDYIIVNAAVTNDLTIEAVNTVPVLAVFAKESNTVKITSIKNIGTSPLTDISLALYASDVSDGTAPVNTTTIASLASGEATTITLVDPTIRNLEGGNITYTAVVDPENLISESDETNNKISADKPVKYNGYKGKRYWESGSDITTKETYDLQGNLIYFTQPSSAYSVVNWTGRTENWTESVLQIPTGSTVEKVLLYIAYNWDTTRGGVPNWTATFNGNSLENGTLYTDRSNFGTYANHTYGLYVFDVTDQFKTSGNSLVMTPGSGNSNAMYPSTLVVIYQNSAETRKQIFINDECDELAYSLIGFGTTLEEATAYAPFTGMSIETNKVQNAMLYSFAGSAGSNEGNLLFNGNIVATNAWQGSSSTSSAQVFDVKSYLNETGNEAGIQGTTSGGMAALQQILVIEYQESAPVANFTANVTSGDAPLTVNFTDQSTGTPASWLWDFGDGTNTTEQNPLHTYANAGIYSVKLTVTNAGGSDEELKTGYITVTEPPIPEPDLVVSSITLNAGEIFANEVNAISAKVENSGSDAVGFFTVRFTVNGVDTNVTVDSLSAGANNTLLITDPALRAYRDNVEIIVTADAENAIAESNETNNALTFSKTVVYNGYKGKRWTDGNDISTQATFEGKYGLVYSSGDASYNGAKWTEKTYSWTASDLQIPEGASVVSARLYQPYSYNQMASDPEFTMSFNGNLVAPDATYTDRKNFGSYDFPYGLYAYNVTSLFNPEGNSITVTPDAGNNYALFGAYMVVVYSDQNASYKKIWINEEFDMLYCYASYAVTSEEATAYAPFLGVNTTGLSKATAVAVLASAGDYGKSKFFFNDYEYTGFWLDYNTTPQTGFSSYDVSGAIRSGENTARFQSYNATKGDNMYAMNAILVVEYSEPAPMADFTANTTSGTAPLTVLFTDNSTGTLTSWAWDFENDGTVDSTEQNPSHTYTTSGTYTVNLTVTGPGGSDSAVKEKYIAVSEPSMPIEPIAAFTADVTNGTAPLTVNITDESTGMPTSWYWDFGDGVNSTEQNVSHTYTLAGTYIVNLTVSNANGTDSTSALITVSKTPVVVLPVANFSTDVSEGSAPLSVQFTDLSENATEWYWDFGDGANSTEQSPAHTYSAAGNYTVNLKVSNANGTDSKTGYITVTEVPEKPIADFSASPSSGEAPLIVSFTDNSTGSPTSWEWSFGDGTSSTGQNPVHTYSEAGKYTVSLTVKNYLGRDKVRKSNYIIVSSSTSLPVADFSATPTSGSVPLEVEFTDNSTGSPTSWEWSFGDKTYSTEQNPVHTYSKPGKYTVTLTVTNADGSNSVTKSNYISVSKKSNFVRLPYPKGWGMLRPPAWLLWKDSQCSLTKFP